MRARKCNSRHPHPTFVTCQTSGPCRVAPRCLHCAPAPLSPSPRPSLRAPPTPSCSAPFPGSRTGPNGAERRRRAETSERSPAELTRGSGPSGTYPGLAAQPTERGRAEPSGAELGRIGSSGAERGRAEPSRAEPCPAGLSGAERRARAVAAAAAMKRDRLGRFLSPGTAGQRGGSGGGGGGACGSGRTRGRPARSGPSVDEAAALVAARLGWGLARARGDTGEDGADEAGTGRALAMGHCRLCHGKFSSRSLRSISGRAPGESADRPPPGEPVFIRDFQHLLGVAVHQDPALSQFVCKNCHAQFYQCHGLLKSFLQRVNVSPAGHRKTCTKDILSEDENDKKQSTQSSDESFDPYPEKKVSGKKSESKEAKKAEEPKMRKKPGPKPGWKNKLRCEREELPTIYKCPYQGCTAVYRGADGMKKHIKEHHEEVRERPCPHPGCNKVFMIDRYLQRHVKLIHTEVRNYICDECGQTFKQRKHLLVHQMRHSGAKPLQCEVCGFQCRQRASLKYHMTKHKAETELDFACDQCGRRFEKAHNLNVHMSMVHPLTQTQDKALPLEPPCGTTEGQAVKPEPT
ncbi:zinc finger protein 276 isoform X4 [Felis catus]|uniref:zinc finger protein 276 isoform X4 n=1 Tax=Felis catus TaxID=9685 RepID=UPI001D19F879|nr:zinc finger protein 276 isoform X4 [Felis catus]